MVMRLLIPILSALLFRMGGMDQWKWCPINKKCWRWGMGLVIGVMWWKGWLIYGIVTGTYFVAKNVFGYGDKTPILKYLPQNVKHLVSGVVFGLASFPLLGWWAILQSLISGVAFYVIEVKRIDNPWAEFGRGFLGTICV